MAKTDVSVHGRDCGDLHGEIDMCTSRHSLYDSLGERKTGTGSGRGLEAEARKKPIRVVAFDTAPQALSPLTRLTQSPFSTRPPTTNLPSPPSTATSVCCRSAPSPSSTTRVDGDTVVFSHVAIASHGLLAAQRCNNAIHRTRVERPS